MTSEPTFGQSVVQVACELEEAPDPDRPNMLTINKKDLEAIIDEHLDWWLLNVYDPPPDTQ